MCCESRESSVSRRIRDLEAELGTPLFVRRSSGVTPTLAGQRLFPRAQAILRQVTTAIEEIAPIGSLKKESIRIGVSFSLSSNFLSELLQRFSVEHERVEIQIVDGSATEHLAAIGDLRMDVAFEADAPASPDCEAATLWSERLVVTVPEEHDLARLDELRWTDLLDQTFIESDRPGDEELRICIRKRFEEFGRDPRIRSHSIGRESLTSLVAMGWGLTFATEAMTALQVPGVAYRPVVDEAITFSAVWLGENDNPALRHLLAMARAMSADFPAR